MTFSLLPFPTTQIRELSNTRDFISEINAGCIGCKKLPRRTDSLLRRTCVKDVLKSSSRSCMFSGQASPWFLHWHSKLSAIRALLHPSATVQQSTAQSHSINFISWDLVWWESVRDVIQNKKKKKKHFHKGLHLAQEHSSPRYQADPRQAP